MLVHNLCTLTIILLLLLLRFGYYRLSYCLSDDWHGFIATSCTVKPLTGFPVRLNLYILFVYMISFVWHYAAYKTLHIHYLGVY